MNASDLGRAAPIVRTLGLVDYRPTWQAMLDFTAARNAQTPDELWLWQAYRKRLVADIQTGQVKLAELEEVRERCRRTLVTRSKDKKLLEKLKSNKAERHAQQEKLAEQNENDDMASIRYQPPTV